MALSAADLASEIDNQMSAIVGADYDAQSDDIKASLCTAIANAVYVWLLGGTGSNRSDGSGAVTHAGADFTVGGDDSAGDTPDNITVEIS
jgi:hypothetical protein